MQSAPKEIPKRKDKTNTAKDQKRIQQRRPEPFKKPGNHILGFIQA